MPTSIEELMEMLRDKTYQYAIEMGIQIDHNGFARCLSGTHADNNPSMHWWEEKNIFHCFSCSFVADLFTLCNKLEGKPMNGPDFIEENVFYLANKFGIPFEHLRKTLTPEEYKKHTLLRTMKTFAEYVTSHAREDYLQARNITKETAEKLMIGSIPSYQELENYMLSQQCSLEIMKEIGIKLGFVNEHKLIFIIKDHWNRPVSFVSRNMNPNAINTPKYINGLETVIYEKRKIFFNWSNIKKEFNPLDTLLVVEGYIDAVTPYQHGIRKVAALGSASFTKEHLEFLEKENRINRIAFALDNDTIGNKRTEKIVEAIQGMKLRKTYWLAINKTRFKDLDEALNSGEVKSINDIYDIVSLFDYEIQKLKENPEISESAIFDKFVTIICQTKSPKEREEQARTLAKYLTEYSYKTILEQVDYIVNGKTERFRNEVIEITKKAFNNINKNPDYIEEIIDNVKEDVEDIKEKYNKKEGNIFERGITSFEKQEQEKANESLFKIDFGIPWFDDLELMPGNSIIVSGLPNTGKTTILQQLAVNVACYTPNGFILYITTDDNKEKVYNNIIANLSNLGRDYCSNPYYHPKFGKSLNTEYGNKLFEQYLQYKEYVKRLIETKKILILDVKDRVDSWFNFQKVIKEIGSMETMEEKYKVMIVDSANKIDVEDRNEKDPIGFVSAQIKKLSERYKFLTFINFELNKTHNRSKLSQFNLSGSRRMFYDCNVLGFVYNPRKNLQGYYDTKMLWDNAGVAMPVLVTMQEKSKNGNNQNNNVPYFYKLNEFTSKLIPITIQQEYDYYFNIWNYEFNEQYGTTNINNNGR